MTGVLVTGGTGKIGRELVRLLRGRGVPVRVASRNPAADDPDAIRFDWDDPATHPAALDGQDRVFVVPPVQSVDPMPSVGPFLAEAQRLGVRKVVLLDSAIPLAFSALEMAADPEEVTRAASAFSSSASFSSATASVGLP